MNPEMQMVHVQQDTFVPEHMDAGGEPPAGPNPLVKLHQYLRGRYLKAITTGLVLGAIAATAGYIAVPLKYTSVGQIQIISTVLTPLPGVGGENSPISNYETHVQTQVELLRRQDVIRRAIQSQEWKTVAPSNGKDEQEIIANFTDALEVFHPSGTELIVVRFRHADKNAAKVGVDALVTAYKQLYDTLTPDSYATIKTTLATQRTEYQNKISTLQRLIEEAMPDKFGTDLEQLHAQNLARIEELRGLIASTDQTLAVLGTPATAPATSQEAPSTTRPESVEVTLELAAHYDPDIARLTSEIDRSRLEIDKLTRDGKGPSHPSVRSYTLALAAAEQARQVRFEKVKDDLKHRPEPINNLGAGDSQSQLAPERIAARRAELQRELDKRKSDSDEEVKNLRRVEKWRDELATNQARLSQIETQIFGNDVNRTPDAVDRRVRISEASTPIRPDKDRRIVAAAGGGLGGLLLGFGIFAAVGFFDRRLRSVADARDSLDRSNRILGILPYLPEDLADPEQSSSAAYCVHHIRTLLQVGGSNSSVFAVTSASPGDGKTSLVISLGLSYAATGAKTLLIDSDLIGAGLSSRASAIARRKIGSILLREKRISQQQLDEALDRAHREGKRLGEVLVDLGFLQQSELDKALSMQQESSLGLLDVLDGEPLSDCIFPGWANNLSILPVGNVGASHAGQISLRSIRKIIAEARTQYDIILIDTGPILGSLEASLICAAVDEVIVTVARDQQRPLVERTFSRIREVGARIAGIVFNRAPREDVELNGYMASITSQRLQSPVLRESDDSDTKRLQRLGPVVRAVAGDGSKPAGDGQ